MHPRIRSISASSRSIVCQALQQAEDELAAGELSRDRVQELFNETLKRLEEAPVQRISIGEWLTDWLDGKESVAPNTRDGYEQVVREFLEYLVPSSRLLQRFINDPLIVFRHRRPARVAHACSPPGVKIGVRWPPMSAVGLARSFHATGRRRLLS
jgi:hypothetical protein